MFFFDYLVLCHHYFIIIFARVNLVKINLHTIFYIFFTE